MSWPHRGAEVSSRYPDRASADHELRAVVLHGAADLERRLVRAFVIQSGEFAAGSSSSPDELDIPTGGLTVPDPDPALSV